MISVTILTKNSEKYLREVLHSTLSFSEVIVYDTGSIDNTIQIAKEFSNVKVFQGPFEGFGLTHNKASSLTTYEWVLSLDSDEIITAELLEEISNLKLDPDCVYSVPRNNYFNKKWIRWCGWYPDRQLRLYNKKNTSFDDALVHEAIRTQGMKTIPLHSALNHYPYESTSDFLSKMQNYSHLFADQNCGKKSSSLRKAIFHGFYSFFKSYFLKRGFLGGREGFIISIYNGNTAFYKYLKLKEYNQRLKQP
jgi:glycosyltransferase involved in cell wall biosynthesis